MAGTANAEVRTLADDQITKPYKPAAGGWDAVSSPARTLPRPFFKKVLGMPGLILRRQHVCI